MTHVAPNLLRLALLGALSTAVLAQSQESIDTQARRDVRLMTNRLDILDTGLNKISERLSGQDGRVSALDQRLGDENGGLTKKVNDVNLRFDKIGVPTRDNLHRFWVLLAAVLVFFMQAGFKCLEVGMSRRRNDAGVGIMNLMNWLILCLVFYIAGFGLMFGDTVGGVIGANHFLPNEGDGSVANFRADKLVG